MESSTSTVYSQTQKGSDVLRSPVAEREEGCVCLFVWSPAQTARVFKPREDDGCDGRDGCDRGCAADKRRVCGYATGRKGQGKGDHPDPDPA